MSDFTVNFENDYPIRFEIENYRPARPAPPCSNPDSPAFSDPGDDAEYDVKAVYIILDKTTKKKNPITGDFDQVYEEFEIELSDEAIDFLPQKIWEEVDRELEKQYEEAIDIEVDRMERDIEFPRER